jgi:colanic acid/amylovoran biosynthesis glycosyltransferase
MNILLVTPWPLDFAGGVTAVVRTLGRELTQHGDHVTYLLPKQRGRLESWRFEGQPVYKASVRGTRLRELSWRGRLGFIAGFPLTCWQLWRVIRRERIQIVNIHYFFGPWKYFLYLRRVLPFRLVVSLHGGDVLGVDAGDNLDYLERWSSAIDRVVFCSNAFRQQVLGAGSRLRQKSTVILNGLDIDSAPEGVAKAPRRAYLVCVAHLHKHKAHDVLLRAFKELDGSHSELELDLVGDGPFRSELEALASELDIRGRVNFRGRVSRETALEYLGGARAMCLPSRRETFGLVVAEAMLLGVPVVATTVGGIPEIVRDEIDGLLVPPDDPRSLAEALERILSDGALRARLTEAGGRRARESFTAARFAADYRRVFASLLET